MQVVLVVAETDRRTRVELVKRIFGEKYFSFFPILVETLN